ncbi:MarR family winged helix-turn-helix transcriptional regulator [Alicyclobacillus fastidiosus]|uniref:MarR family transcriptional regulator n=1 Tax=Alicyclobacillus fastidiosus TaxID=392011 RepID=A0ABV5ACH4_9BACL|nr:MarR family transcriptional regulator [Alicyclobacillus fastidiosus]WEH10288.1 MarR family transcriptional regulator [Alicyclobacillus fastidiosus]
MKVNFSEFISILIHNTDLIFTNYVKATLYPFNLAPEQNLIMMLLWEQDGLNQNEIADKLKKDKTNVARMISNLEQKGFIHRVTGEDRRSLRVYLTDQGKELGDDVIPLIHQFNDLVCKGITDEEIEQMRRILLKMSANVQ